MDWYEEGLFDVVADIFMLKESKVFTRSDLISSSFISIVTSGSTFSASILMPTLLLKIFLSMCSSKGVVIKDILFSCLIIFDENLIFHSLRTLV